MVKSFRDMSMAQQKGKWDQQNAQKGYGFWGEAKGQGKPWETSKEHEIANRKLVKLRNAEYSLAGLEGYKTQLADV
eukprot:8288415-Heterocapsa_arctica.AAC.1